MSERWPEQDEPWLIQPFAECVVSIGPDPVLTGYVDGYQPMFDRAAHGVRILGRSRTEDLIDCTPDIQSGQFAGYTVEAIARSICGLFKIDVAVETDGAAAVVADAKTRTMRDRLDLPRTAVPARRRPGLRRWQGSPGIDPRGSTRAAGRLAQGENILRAQSSINVHRRFSDYIVKGQHGVGGAATGGLDLSALHGPGPASYAGRGGVVQTGQGASALDAGVPRYRPHVTLAESQLDQAGMQLRANGSVPSPMAAPSRCTSRCRAGGNRTDRSGR